MLKAITKGCEPTKGSKNAACIDLYAAHSAVIEAGQTVMVGLGVQIDIDKIRELFTYDVGTEFKDGDLVQFTADGALNATEFDKFMNSHYMQLQLRSSLGKDGLILPNGVGIIDMDYSKEIKMIIHNPINGIRVVQGYGDPLNNDNYHIHMQTKYKIEKGDKIGQIMLCKHETDLMGVHTDKERTGGFGSTGK